MTIILIMIVNFKKYISYKGIISRYQIKIPLHHCILNFFVLYSEHMPKVLFKSLTNYM